MDACGTSRKSALKSQKGHPTLSHQNPRGRPRDILPANAAENSSLQAIRMRSAESGISSAKNSAEPASARAAAIALRVAKKAGVPMKKGGSPTAREEWTALEFGLFLRIVTRKSTGTSLKAGIL